MNRCANERAVKLCVSSAERCLSCQFGLKDPAGAEKNNVPPFSDNLEKRRGRTLNVHPPPIRAKVNSRQT